MFTGLVRTTGTVMDSSNFGKGRRFRINLGTLAGQAEVGQSIAINGACLTITSVAGSEATFDAVSETVSRTNLGPLKAGDLVNLEPALKVGDALDGHIVLGHVDALGTVLNVEAATADNRIMKIGLPANIQHLVAEKGSIAVDGISLTVGEVCDDWFNLAIIPHTWENCTLSRRRPGDGVNLEADVLARYAARILGCDSQKETSLTEKFLKENGFA